MSNLSKTILAVSLIGILILLYKNKGSKKALSNSIDEIKDFNVNSNLVVNAPVKPTVTIKPVGSQQSTQTQTQTSGSIPSQQSNTNPFLLPSLQQAAQEVSTFTSGMGDASLYDLFPPNYFVSTSEVESSVASQANTSWQQTQVAQYAIEQALQGSPNFQYSLYELPSGGYGLYVTDANNRECPHGTQMGTGHICEWVGS